jgi:hypothetical protein
MRALHRREAQTLGPLGPASNGEENMMTRTGTHVRIREVLAGVSLLALALTFAPPFAPAAATSAVGERFDFTSLSYGSNVLVGKIVRSGPSAISGIGCTGAAPQSRSDTAGSVAGSSEARSASVATSASTSKSPVSAHSSSVVHGMNLLGSSITATAVSAASTTSRDADGYDLSSAGTEFEGMVILGKHISRTVAPNTMRVLPGIGYVLLNQESSTESSSSASLAVTAVHVVVTEANRYGIAPSTNIFVAHAMTALAPAVSGMLGGDAYGSSVTRNKTAGSGPKFEVFMPCLGTSGRTLIDGGADLQEGSIANGTDRNTADGVAGATNASGTLTATVHDVNLLGGLLSATEVHAAAHASKDNGVVILSDAGSAFTGFKLSDFNLGPNPSANTVKAIPGIGTLYLHRVVRTARSIEVIMIELIVNQSNSLGLPIGSVEKVGVAVASVR